MVVAARATAPEPLTRFFVQKVPPLAVLLQQSVDLRRCNDLFLTAGMVNWSMNQAGIRYDV